MRAVDVSFHKQAGVWSTCLRKGCVGEAYDNLGHGVFTAKEPSVDEISEVWIALLSYCN